MSKQVLNSDVPTLEMRLRVMSESRDYWREMAEGLRKQRDEVNDKRSSYGTMYGRLLSSYRSGLQLAWEEGHDFGRENCSLTVARNLAYNPYKQQGGS